MRNRTVAIGIGLLAFLFVLGVLIFVHELGHFLLARWNGVRVLTFSLGFGPKLLKFRRGDELLSMSVIRAGAVSDPGRTPPEPTEASEDDRDAGVGEIDVEVRSVGVPLDAHDRRPHPADRRRERIVWELIN